MMKDRSRGKAKKAKTARKIKRPKVHAKVRTTKRYIHQGGTTAELSRVKESIENYNKGDTVGFATVDEIWKFAESDQ